MLGESSRTLGGRIKICLKEWQRQRECPLLLRLEIVFLDSSVGMEEMIAISYRNYIHSTSAIWLSRRITIKVPWRSTRP